MEDGFLIFAFVGFLAQIVDGALGMAYGLVSSSVLLSFGVPPAAASASVHAAEVFTTAASASSHTWNRNVNWRLFWMLAPAGVLSGVAGAYVLTSFDGEALRPFVAGYLVLMGLFILWRFYQGWPPRATHRLHHVAPMGAVGGFIDAVGGGGWGPVVTTGLIGAGGAPREVIGTVNTTEFFLTTAVSASFLVALVTGHWSEAGDVAQYGWAVAGLIVGGVLAAPFAGYIARVVPPRLLLGMVGLLVTGLALEQLSRFV